MLHRIIDQANAEPDHIALQDLDAELTYAELVEAAARLAAGLSARGVRQGDRVALLLPNSVDFVVAALASLWIGAIFVPLAVTDPEPRLTTIMGDCAPAIVIGVDGAGDEAARTSLGGLPVVSIEALRKEGSSTSEASPASSRLAYAIYTSGTTGTPKGVLIGNPAFLAAVESIAVALGLTRSCRTLCVSPFYFDGSFGTLYSTLFVGGTAIIRPRDALLFPRTFFNAVATESITYTGFSPSYLRILLASPQLMSLAESTLEIIALGGEACSIADIRALWAVAPNIRVFNRYGPTEATIAVSNLELTPENTADGIVPLGTPHSGVSFHLVDEQGGIVAEPDRVGELYIGGSQLMTGYWRAAELTDAVLRTDVVPGETVYRSGDLVYRNQQGLYVYVDRADRVIKRSGVRISLIELSETFRALDGVSAAACVVFDDDDELGIVAFVVAEESMSIRDLQLAARDVLPDTMLPDRIEIIDSFPLAHSSKIDERALLASVGLRPLQAAPVAGEAVSPDI
ncbi:MAG TPA: amino acid adenylation domain-containing protein [Acidimicrobiales bacterium]